MIKVYSEIDLRDFRAWSGGKDTMEELTCEELDTLDDCLSDLYPDGMSETQLNDILWFDRDFIAETLGFYDWDELCRKHSGEDEREEDDD